MSSPTPPPVLTPPLAAPAPAVSPPWVRPSWLSKLGFAFSVLAMVLVLVLAFAGKNQIEKTRAMFGERLQKESTTLDLLKEQMSEVGDLSKDLKTRFELLEQAQKEEASQRASLAAIYNNLLASRTEVSLAEVDQLISIAKRQLYLLGNTAGAAVALSQAVDLLQSTNKPGLVNLRLALEADLLRIRSLPADDLFRLTLELDAVIAAVDALPSLAGARLTSQTQGSSSASINGQESSGPKRANPSSADSSSSKAVPAQGTAQVFVQWLGTLAAGVWVDIRSLFEVTKVGTPQVLMLSASQEVQLRQALRLSLLNARLTLLTRQGDLLKADVERSQTLLTTYFDGQSPMVQKALQTLQRVASAQVSMQLPDLQATTSAYRLAVASEKPRGSRP